MSKLFLVPTPIGNLKDITLRALDILNSVDLILSEDTRISGRLLKHYGIQKPLKKYNKDNEHQSAQYWVDKVKAGQNIALISDAGTPGISDPGFLLSNLCISQDIEVECLAGPVAFIPALLASGIACDRFCFEGFLPHKKGRQKRLQELLEETKTIIFYESPHRIERLISELHEIFGEKRQACISREISKIHEEHLRGSLAELKIGLEEKKLKGEIVVILEGKKTEKKIKQNKYKSS